MVVRDGSRKAFREGVEKTTGRNGQLVQKDTVGMPLQTLHFAYLPDERVFLSERPFYKGKPRLKVRLIPESRYQAADIYFCGGLDSAPLCENWSEIAQK